MNTVEGGISPDERAGVIRLLRDTEEEFLELTSRLDNAQWFWQSAANGWSAAHAAEHLVLGELAMLGRIKQALNSPRVPDWQAQDTSKSKLLARVLPDRDLKAIAPVTLEPHGQWRREETLARYREGRARTLRFAAESELPMKAHCAEHPFPVFNMLNAYQWLTYIALHNLRHNKQVAEILKEMPR